MSFNSIPILHQKKSWFFLAGIFLLITSFMVYLFFTLPTISVGNQPIGNAINIDHIRLTSTGSVVISFPNKLHKPNVNNAVARTIVLGPGDYRNIQAAFVDASAAAKVRTSYLPQVLYAVVYSDTDNNLRVSLADLPFRNLFNQYLIQQFSVIK